MPGSYGSYVLNKTMQDHFCLMYNLMSHKEKETKLNYLFLNGYLSFELFICLW
jgi:hypothetical protein